jgi:hypothetical protein
MLDFGDSRQRKGGMFILIINFDNIGGRRKNISNIEISIVNGLVSEL